MNVLKFSLQLIRQCTQPSLTFRNFSETSISKKELRYSKCVGFNTSVIVTTSHTTKYDCKVSFKTRTGALSDPCTLQQEALLVLFVSSNLMMRKADYHYEMITGKKEWPLLVNPDIDLKQ